MSCYTDSDHRATDSVDRCMCADCAAPRQAMPTGDPNRLLAGGPHLRRARPSIHHQGHSRVRRRPSRPSGGGPGSRSQHNLEEPEAVTRVIRAAGSVIGPIVDPGDRARAIAYLAERIGRSDTLSDTLIDAALGHGSTRRERFPRLGLAARVLPVGGSSNFAIVARAVSRDERKSGGLRGLDGCRHSCAPDATGRRSCSPGCGHHRIPTQPIVQIWVALTSGWEPQTRPTPGSHGWDS